MKEIFEKLYGNIGKKLKIMALIMFGVEFAGFVLLYLFFLIGTAYNFTLLFLTFLFSPVAIIIGGSLLLVLSWPLYAFGELVENSSIIAKKDNLSATTTAPPTVNTAKEDTSAKAESEKLSHWWLCSKCGATISSYPCGVCDYDPEP